MIITGHDHLFASTMIMYAAGSHDHPHMIMAYQDQLARRAWHGPTLAPCPNALSGP